ncbi:MAG TPA: hypothetical protein VJZ71_17275 [Phycisphaerae bacterium]|nr:hypothetical protein [Phycisphaerae bacterium]
MSDLPAKNFSPPILRVADLPSESKVPAYAPRPSDSLSQSGRGAEVRTRPSLIVVPPQPFTFRKIVGFFILSIGVILAAMPYETWIRLVGALPATYTTEMYRWIAAGVFAAAGLLFIPSRAVSVVAMSALFAVTAYAADRLLHHRASGWLTAHFGAGFARYILAIGALLFGYWIQAWSRTRISARGVLGLGLTLLAAFGTIYGWYDWSPVAERLGPGVMKVLKEWGRECTWATVLVLTALGVSSSRTRPIHFLIALLLGALAYYCVREGYSQVHNYPQLSTTGKMISVESLSYSNVDLWRWIVAAELTLLAMILLHLAAGVGGLSMAMALSWMISGMAIYHSLGSMSLVRSISDAASGAGQSRVDPLANMGIPVDPTSPRVANPGLKTGRWPVPAAPLTTVEPRGFRMDASVRQALIREVAPMALMFLTAVLAGILAVAGFNLLSDHGAFRSLVNSALWFGFGIGLTALVWVWPRDADRSWEAWLASWRMSRYHAHTIWLIFVGTMALVSMFSMTRERRASSWVHLGAAAAFVGTLASLATLQILISFGGFARLPAWVYIVVAIGQSSMGWILMTNLSFAKLGSPKRAVA